MTGPVSAAVAARQQTDFSRNLLVFYGDCRSLVTDLSAVLPAFDTFLS